MFHALEERVGVSAAALEQRAAVLAAEDAGLLQRREPRWDEKQE